jgi:hypothetical protein
MADAACEGDRNELRRDEDQQDIDLDRASVFPIARHQGNLNDLDT